MTLVTHCCAIAPEDEPEDDFSDEYEPDAYADGFVGCQDFNEGDLWEL